MFRVSEAKAVKFKYTGNPSNDAHVEQHNVVWGQTLDQGGRSRPDVIEYPSLRVSDLRITPNENDESDSLKCLVCHFACRIS